MGKFTGYWINNYVDKMNKHCPSLDDNKVIWTVDDLQPNTIRKYCKIDSMGNTSICWSCDDYLKQYLNDLEQYELSVNSVNDTLKEILNMQTELDKKMDYVINIINNNNQKMSN